MSIFTEISKVPKRHLHKLGFMNTMTIQDFGILYPIIAKELVPGDVLKHRHAMNLSFFPQFANVMHGFKLCTYYFFVPYRIVYPDWDKFISQVNGQYSTPYVKPYVQARDLFNLGTNHEYWRNGSLADYLNLNSWQINPNSTYPVWDSADDNKIDTLFFRAYQKIWVDHFIDTEVNGHVTFAKYFEENIIPHSSGENTSDFSYLFQLRSKCWNKDLFTTSLKNTRVAGVTPTVSGTITMDDIRTLAATNSWYELLMRIGQRPKEFIRGVFGVTPKDYRLDMAEFIDAYSEPIIKGSVVNHNASTGSDEDAQGFIASEFKTGGVSRSFKYKAREFGVFMGLCCLVPDAVYYQGMNRQFLKQEPTDYFLPQFEHIGDQMTLNQELYMQVKTSADPQNPNKQGFGFAPRYSEYKYWDNEVHGMFREDSYLSYHAAKHYSSLPSRNSGNFAQIQVSSAGSIIDPSDLKRIFNISSGAPIASLQFYHDCPSLRPMSKDSTPRIKG